MNRDLEQKSIDTIRFLCIDAVEKANSGHPGICMGAAPVALVLWSRPLRFNPREPRWANRDRFVLSAGHGSMLVYAMLHLAGFDVRMADTNPLPQCRPVPAPSPPPPPATRRAGGPPPDRSAKVSRARWGWRSRSACWRPG